MKTVCNNKFTQAICTISMVMVLTSMAFAYPPDNAAVLYYRASLAYDANDAMMDKKEIYPLFHAAQQETDAEKNIISIACRISET